MNGPCRRRGLHGTFRHRNPPVAHTLFVLAATLFEDGQLMSHRTKSGATGQLERCLDVQIRVRLEVDHDKPAVTIAFQQIERPDHVKRLHAVYTREPGPSGGAPNCPLIIGR